MWSEEELLLRYDECNSNMYSNNQGNLLGSSSDKDVHHTCIRVMGTQKYFRKSYYYRIECTAATFLATFMWKRPLNSAVLTIITH